MTETHHESSPWNTIELDIIKAFGWSILLGESLLYERFIHLSTKRSLMTKGEFRNCLKNMEMRGVISEEKLHGRRAYRLLVTHEMATEGAGPQTPQEEMKILIGSLAARIKAQRGRDEFQNK